MALMTVRILRMAVIVVKEFTQPVKKLFVNVAQRNKFFRQYIINPPARGMCIHKYIYPDAHSVKVHFKFQGYQWCEKSLLMLLSKDKHLEQLTEEGTIDLGAAIWAEIVVFVGCSKVVLVETNK